MLSSGTASNDAYDMVHMHICCKGGMGDVRKDKLQRHD